MNTRLKEAADLPTEMKILVCNAGSTSLKFKLYQMPQGAVLARERGERVGSRVRSLVIPTDEEKGIADWTYRYQRQES